MIQGDKPVFIEGTPIASGSDGHPPEWSFNNAEDVFWVSPERGGNIRGNAWIGCKFNGPRIVRRFRLRQTSDLVFRQDAVIVQVSENGETWTTIDRGNIGPEEIEYERNLPDVGHYQYWRLLADADNAETPEHAWTPISVAFYEDAGESA